jgi:NADPH:quinone reductase-like Zn-dependent oxidoreductase
MKNKKAWTILGQDIEILIALWSNLLSWFFATFAPNYAYILLPSCSAEDRSGSASKDRTKCIAIGRPGGLEQLRLITLKENTVTVGYNLRNVSLPPFAVVPYSNDNAAVPSGCLIVRNQYFSVNYADCTIRWGLYESAKQYVGYPIVPGFDVAGIVESVGENSNDETVIGFRKGDRVFGCTLFGAYSDRILIPTLQLRKIPDGISTREAAAIPAVSLTALYALFLAGVYPVEPKLQYSNRSALIHSAAGGVGSMLVQMAKLLGMSPVVGIVGSSTKIAAVKELGCDVVMDRSAYGNDATMWNALEEAVPNGFAAIFDANGVSTLQKSYEHLSPTGRLVIYGFHSNLPLGRDMLSPLEWIRMSFRQSCMPRFDPMQMTVSNKSVLAFNLSFFAEEKQLVSSLLDQIVQWLMAGQLRCPTITEISMDNIASAHDYLQSGKSIGKIVVRTGVD